MNKNNQKIALVSGLIIAVGATIYFLRKNKTPIEVVGEDVDDVKVNSNDAFLDKAKALQALLGFKGLEVDGIIGTNTKARLSALGVTTTVNASNIDSVIAEVREKQKSKETQASKEATQTARITKAKQIANALTQVRKLTWIDKNAVMPTFRKDLLGGKIKSGSFSFKKNDVVDVISWKIMPDGFIEVFLGGEGFIYVSPFSVSVFK